MSTAVPDLRGRPDISEVLSWLNYLDSQCPECTQIEWPTDY